MNLYVAQEQRLSFRFAVPSLARGQRCFRGEFGQELIYREISNPTVHDPSLMCLYK